MPSQRVSEQQLRREIGSRPAKFAKRDTYEARDKSSATFNALCVRAEKLSPKDAVRLAQRLLVAVDDNGIDYADFQSAQAVQRYVRKAINALNGLSLS